MKYIFFLLAVAGLLASCQQRAGDGEDRETTSTDRQRPNVLYIMADDLTTQAIGAYGSIYRDVAPTPNMDRLAAAGMLFEDVLCTNAICGPSRAAILTGNYSNRNGYYKNESGGRFNTDQWTFPEAFQQNGYRTALFGKWHLGSRPQGFDEFRYHNSAGQQGHYWDPVYNVNGEDTEFEGYATNLTTDFALSWLDTVDTETEPFMMVLQFKAPHRPWEPDRKYETLWDDIEMPYPATFDDDYAGRELTAGDTEMTMEHLSRRDMKLEQPDGLERGEALRWDFYGTKNGEVVQPDGLSEEEGRKWRYQRYIKDYLACVKSVDDNLGRVLDYLDESGLAENTVVVLTSDQGFYLGDHGFFDKRFIYEESLRMPFVMRYPGRIPAGSTNQDVITNVDFAPTLLQFAGIEAPENIHGNSFAHLARGKDDPDWRQSMYYHYYEFPFWHHVQPHYGIRTPRYTLAHFYYNIDTWELYDNQEDPDQLHNVIDDPAYAEVIDRLKSELRKLQQEYGDDLPLADYREITDRDFGRIVDDNGQETVEDILNNE